MVSASLAIDAIIGLILIEFIGLAVWLARKKATGLIGALASFLLSGLLLMIALRVALAPAPNEPLVLALIAASFPAHLATLYLVWRAVQKK